MRKDYLKIFICFFIFSAGLFLIMKTSYAPKAEQLSVSKEINNSSLTIMATGYIKNVQASCNVDQSEKYINEILNKADCLIGSTNIESYKLTSRDKKLIKRINYDVTENDFSKTYTVEKVHGVNIGVSYINCVPNESGKLKEEQIEDIKTTIKSMKNSEAQIIIFYMNWNEGNKIDFGDYKKNMGELLNKNGVDIVIGCDGKSVKPIEKIKNEETGHITYMAYSIGNLVEGSKNKGIILQFDIDNNSLGSTITKVSYMPILSKVSKDKTLLIYPAVNADKDCFTKEDINDITECYSYIKNMAEKQYKTMKIIE